MAVTPVEFISELADNVQMLPLLFGLLQIVFQDTTAYISDIYHKVSFREV